MFQEPAISMIADEDVVDHVPKTPTPPKCGLIFVSVQSGVHHTCGGGHGRKKHHVDKDNLDGHCNDGIQINQNWILKR